MVVPIGVSFRFVGGRGGDLSVFVGCGGVVFFVMPLDVL